MSSAHAPGAPGFPSSVSGPARVVAVAASPGHDFSKQTQPVIRLVEGLGVEGDAHLGTTVQHRSHARRDPTRPNQRQVHLIAAELFTEVRAAGHQVLPGALGENVTTSGVDLLALPVGARLRLGDSAEVEITGLRNPCRQIDDFSPGLLTEVLGRDADGSLVRRSGVMSVVRHGGEVRAGDPVRVELPDGPPQPLEPV